jgi:hypothetical protein
VAVKIHSLVEDTHDLDRASWPGPVHQKVTSAPAVPRNVDRPKPWHNLASGLGPRDVGTVSKLVNRLNERVPVNTRLSRAEFLGGPAKDVRKVELCGGAEAHAPAPPGHDGSIRSPLK